MTASETIERVLELDAKEKSDEYGRYSWNFQSKAIDDLCTAAPKLAKALKIAMEALEAYYYGRVPQGVSDEQAIGHSLAAIESVFADQESGA